MKIKKLMWLFACSLLARECFASNAPDEIDIQTSVKPSKRVELFYSKNDGLCQYVENFLNSKFLDRDLNTAAGSLIDKTPDLFGDVQWEYFDELSSVAKALIDINNDGVKEEVVNSFFSGKNWLEVYKAGADVQVYNINTNKFIGSKNKELFMVHVPIVGTPYFFRKLYKPDQNGEYHVDFNKDPYMRGYFNSQIFKYQGNFYLLILEAFEEPFSNALRRYRKPFGYIAVVEMVNDVEDDGVEPEFKNLNTCMWEYFSDRCFMKRYF